MIGLQRGTVRLEKHQSEWICAAQSAVTQIREILGKVLQGCEHVGSSSVAELEAKPIIDLAVGVRSFDDVEPYIETLERAGYIRRPGADVDDEMFFAAGDFEADTRTHHVHVVIYHSQRWHDYIDFREALRSDRVLRSTYQEVKQQLAQKYPKDRGAYNEGKKDFVLQTLAHIRDRRYVRRGKGCESQ